MHPHERRDAAARPTSWASSAAAQHTMIANHRRDTDPELRVRRLLYAAGYRYRVDYSLPLSRRRSADVAFPRQRLSVFIDGCFWHGCPDHYVPPLTNADFWARKVAVNRARDADTNARLLECGWNVRRYWEHTPPSSVVADIVSVLHALRNGSAD